MDDFVPDATLSFLRVLVHDPENPNREESYRSWWPIAEIRAQHERIQRHFDHFPGTRGYADNHELLVGERDTIFHISQTQGNQEEICAVLISASLFKRMDSRRAEYPRENWPLYSISRFVRDIAYERWGVRHAQWHHSCTQVLPVMLEDHHDQIDSIEGLIRRLAEEHASLFIKYQLVEVTFGQKRDPFVENSLKKEYEAERIRMAPVRKDWAIEKARREEKDDELSRLHPRWRQWRAVPPSELESLVWSMPTVEVAKLFGVTDVAVSKKCKSLNIRKPPPGFWAKVSSQKIPHPRGKPQVP
ncbi:MAG: hypothetical protein ACREVL_13290 [Solimonas sp.]